MSTLKVSALQGLSASSDAITLANDGTCTANITNNLSNRNKIINGAMTVSQKYGTSSVQLSATEYYFVDRWKNDSGSSFDMKCDASQSSEAPEGFANSMKFDCDGVSTPTGGHNGLIATFLEGQDLQDLKFGTSNAESITLSFYAKSGSQNNGHVYGVYLAAYLNGTRNSQTKGFTVTSSWQRFTMTFAGTGTAQSTAINNDTNRGMMISFSLASGPDDKKNYSTWTADSNLSGFTGQDNFFDNTSNELYITGVQLEVGSVATDFEHRSYAQELALCQRYFYQYVDGSEYSSGTSSLCNVIGYQNNNAFGTLQFPVTMRAKPTLVHAEGTSYFKIYRNAGSGDLNSMTLQASGKNGANINVYNASSGTSIAQDQGGFMLSNDTGVRVGFSAEL